MKGMMAMDAALTASEIFANAARCCSPPERSYG